MIQWMECCCCWWCRRALDEAVDELLAKKRLEMSSSDVTLDEASYKDSNAQDFTSCLLDAEVRLESPT